jgi:dihydrodipicolinate synthase/N-acetylneuraminate lyase
MAPERFIAVYRAFKDGDLRGAMAAQQHASRVKEIYAKYPVIASTKWVNSRQLGIDCGSPRAPLAPVEAGDEAGLKAMAAELGLLDRPEALVQATARGPAVVRPR